MLQGNEDAMADPMPGKDSLPRHGKSGRNSVMKLFLTVLIAAGCLVTFAATAQPQGFNYDEANVPQYTLPDPLLGADGRSITNAARWEHGRRPEVLKLFEDHVYGRAPRRTAGLSHSVIETDRNALDGKATRKQIRIQLTAKRYGPRMDVLIYLPNQVKGPVPIFLGLNFYGNHTIHADPDIVIPVSWCRSNPGAGVVDNRATEKGRGKYSSRWAVDKILARGYGLATIYYGDIEPDHKDGWKSSLRSYHLAPGQTQPAPEEWGAVGAWAWGLSRAMDYFERDGKIDARRVAVLGHSRLGKTSLWAGASDERFALVISNDSGCGGAALSRRAFGETVKRINTSFPHWFNDNFNRYNDNESALPVDQHMLIALMAPRPVYVASAEDDKWADPNGEFLSARHAGPVYALFGKGGVGVETQPAVNTPVGDFIGYHVRTGKHDVTDYDWERYLDFADRHFKRAAAGNSKPN